MNINRIKKNIKKVEEIVESIDVQDVINRMEKDKENSIEELKKELEELYRTQQARLDAGADDLDIREEIAEVEEEIKELQDETMEENSIKNERSSIEEDIILLKDFTEGNFKRDKLENYKGSYKMGCFYYKDIQQAIEHILSDYKRILKENEKLKALDSSNSKMIANMSKRHFQDREKIRNSIPVQKIKDKIEKLKNNIDYLKQFKDWYEKDYTNEDIINNILEVLQELLGGKKQNE